MSPCSSVLARTPMQLSFSPGVECRAVLGFWADEPASEVVKPGASFEIHYPQQVGDGEVRAILDDAGTDTKRT